MKKAIKISLIVASILVLVGTVIFTVYISNIMKQTKNIEFDKNKIISATKQIEIYDSDDNLINSGSFNGRKVVAISDLKPETIQCFLSIEDKEFYNHKGLNYKRIAKAMLNNLKSRSFKEGASTISQQLIKNTHLSNEKTIDRKVKEMFLTKKLEKTFTKDEILETYLNIIYFGNGCYGIEEASEYYFNKSAKDLTLSESATLAGVIKAPAVYSPTLHPEKSQKRRNMVLFELQEDKVISDEEYYNFSKEPIVLNISKDAKSKETLYMQAVKKEAEKITNLSAQAITLRGYKIYTYFDKNAQDSLENSLNQEDYYHVNSHGNIADSLGVVINNCHGGIEAFYGKSDYDLIDLKRQPGSAIKPILVYAPALDYGTIHNSSMINDEKIDINGYSPNNVGNVFHGYVNVRDAVAKSLNIPAVKIMKEVGIEKCKEFASNSGIHFNKYDNGYALALGGFNEGITLTELTNSFLPFSNNGNFIQSAFIKKITTADGVVIYERKESQKKVMGDDTAYLMTDLLKDGVRYGTSKRLNDLPYDVAGKTGTVAIKNTNLNSDVYSVAYTSEHTVGVWLGNYTFKPEYNLEGTNNGGTYCTNMVKDTLLGLYQDHTPNDFQRPESVVKLKIDAKNLEENHSVKLASETLPDRYTMEEVFAHRFAPTEISNIYTNFDIDFDVELENNIAKIALDAKNYLIYDIYVDNKLIKSITETDGKYEFSYDQLEQNKMYTFNIDAHSPYSDNVQKSKSVSVYTKNLYEELINDTPLKKQDNLSWYFY